MKNLIKLAMFLALVPVLFFSSCKEDEPDAVNAYLTLKSYMVTNTLDLPALLVNWVVDPKSTNMGGIVDSVTGTVPGHTIYDIRSASDFAAGHIKNASNVALKDIVTTVTTAAVAKDAKILVVCSTGQTAGQAVMALRLMGWSKAVVLKWGMAGWNATYKAPWVANSGQETPANGNLADGNPTNWVKTAAPTTGSFAEPVWTSTSTDGAAILKERVQAVLNAGFSTADGATVLASPSASTIINYWSNEDYLTFGHYAGAFNVPSIALAGDLVKAFDPSKDVLVYCYTGQTSSFATFWLNVLGYKTKGIAYGANRMVYAPLKTAKRATYPGPKNWAITTK